MMFEYRVVWQREGMRKRIKIYQTKKGAERFIEKLKGDWIKVYEIDSSQSDYYIDMPSLIFEPFIESIPVGIWTK